MDGAKTARRADHLYERQVGLDLVLLDPEKEVLHILNPTAAIVWRSLTPDRTAKEIADAISNSYDRHDRKDELLADVVYFIDRLAQLGLVVTPGGAHKGSTKIQVMIPDREISVAGGQYEPPSLKTMSLDEVDQINKIPLPPVARFSDTWHPEVN